MRSRTFAPRLVLTGIFAVAIATHAAVVTSAGEGEQRVPVKEAAPLGTPTPPAGAKPAPTPATGASGVIFRDDFAKPALDPAWRVELEDKDRWAIDGSELVIITQPIGKAAGQGEEAPIRNRVVLNRDLEGDFTVTARVNVAIIRPGNNVGLRMRTPDGSSVVLGFGGFEYNSWYRRVFLGKRSGGQYAQLTSGNTWDAGKPTKMSLDNLVKTAETIWLRLERQRFIHIGSYSFDGERFETIGQQVMLRNDGARLELLAYDLGAGVETGARFDLIEITR